MEATRSPGTFKRILVPVDFTPACAHALREADRLARATGAQVVLLHVLPITVDMDDTIGLTVPGAWRSGRKVEPMHDRLIELAGSHLSRPVSFATAVLVQPDTVKSIAGYATIIGADLIVMGIRSRKAGHHKFDEPSPRELIEAATCPVMLVRGGEEPVRIAA